MVSRSDEYYMKKALVQAEKAYAIGETPIGCIIVYEGKVIGRGYNQRMKRGSTLAHGEILAIAQACRYMKDWRLEDCTMYVTLEPCSMCAGAILQSRMKSVVIGAMNPKGGCCGSILNVIEDSRFNHMVDVKRGILETQCAQMMKQFFRELRQNKEKVKV